jgi:hypothetical protein
VGVPQHLRAELRSRRHMRHVAPLSPVPSLDCAYFPSPRGCTLTLSVLGEGLALGFQPRASRTSDVPTSPLPTRFPELRGATFLSPLECADPKSLDLKSFGMNRSKKYRGEGV